MSTFWRRTRTGGEREVFRPQLDVLFVIDRDASIGNKGEAASKLLDNDIVRRTTAWQKGHVVYLDGLSLYVVGGGLTALQNTVDQLNTALAKP